MRLRLASAIAAVALTGGAILASSALVRAEPFDEPYVDRLHHECDRGERKACVRFGIILGEHHDRYEEWRRHHPEWWWWE